MQWFGFYMKKKHREINVKRFRVFDLPHRYQSGKGPEKIQNKLFNVFQNLEMSTILILYCC